MLKLCITNTSNKHVKSGVVYLLVQIGRSRQGTGAVADVWLTAADGHTVVLGFFKPASVPPVRVVVDATAMKLTEEEEVAEGLFQMRCDI